MIPVSVQTRSWFFQTLLYMAIFHFIECGADSKWTGRLPSCNRVSCPQPPRIINAVSLTKGGIKFDDVVQYICENGYV